MTTLDKDALLMAMAEAIYTSKHCLASDINWRTVLVSNPGQASIFLRLAQAALRALAEALPDVEHDDSDVVSFYYQLKEFARE